MLDNDKTESRASRSKCFTARTSKCMLRCCMPDVSFQIETRRAEYTLKGGAGCQAIVRTKQENETQDDRLRCEYVHMSMISWV